MAGKEVADQVARDFEFLKDRVLAVLIFGSAVSEAEAGDVDVCIVAPSGFDLREVFMRVDVAGKNYDVWLFEELPLYMKMEVILNHVVVYCRDILELYEYFYFFRKLWKDQERRNRLTKEELGEMLRAFAGRQRRSA
ncbi:nucleotidyltransferase domain-containing protein [Geoglobus acetivorans]|uniref:Nucleotidyltransferase domain-containing protein n=1 Tax=Geoglobus acetivorans TaxID=565033 RepID=A0ABZ3H2W6_GEOAI|nr:DNA polymerase subunit beta [Geoglobus acetivorans]